MLFSSLYTQGSWGGCHGVKIENLFLDLIDLDHNLYNLQFDVYLQHRHTFLSVDYPTRQRLKLPDTKIKAWGRSVFVKY